LDNRRLVGRSRDSKEKTNSTGRDRIDHPPGAHDDLCNSAAGAIVAAVAADHRPRLLFG